MTGTPSPRKVASNPSTWRRRLPIVAIALLDFVIAGYLALYQAGVLQSVWDPVFETQSQAVLESAVSKAFQRWMHFPDAMFQIRMVSSFAPLAMSLPSRLTAMD